MCYSLLLQALSYDFFLAEEDQEAFEQFETLVAHSENPNVAKLLSQKYRPIDSNPRIYPGYFAPVIVSASGSNDKVSSPRRLIRPMRYRVRPSQGDEIPSKFNVFNARIDSLEKRKTWRSLFGRQHGILVFERFYEWVLGPDKRKMVVSFYPEGKKRMWAPCLWEYWQKPEPTNVTPELPGLSPAPPNEGFYSFAIITDEPPPEVAAVGHDRCPVWLAEDQIDAWLNPQGESKEQLHRILSQREPAIFQHMRDVA